MSVQDQEEIIDFLETESARFADHKDDTTPLSDGNNEEKEIQFVIC